MPNNTTLRLLHIGSISLFTISSSEDPEKEIFENNTGKGENAGNQHFLLFPQCFFYSIKDRNHVFSNNDFVVCKCFEFGQGQNFVIQYRVNFADKNLCVAK